jgi:hypothetical protein
MQSFQMRSVRYWRQTARAMRASIHDDGDLMFLIWRVELQHYLEEFRKSRARPER